MTLCELELLTNSSPMNTPTTVRVLLVDDEPTTHFLHKRVIRKANPEASTISVMNGRAALDFIMEARAGKEECPTHIWLDLQMPHLDGWSFLEAYFKMDEHTLCHPRITIVTSSPNPSDHIRAIGYPNVVAYVEKFVTPEECKRILDIEN